MADWSVNRYGANNGDTDKLELYLKVFSGEIITQFNKANVTGDLVQSRTITSGKSAQFPVLGTITASYHTPGAELVGKSVLSSEKTISIDDLLVSDFSIANFDEAISHYEVRSEYAKQAGLALSNAADKKRLALLYLAARASATLTGGQAGQSVTSSTAGTDAQALLDAISTAAEYLDNALAPESDRHCILAPAQWHLLSRDGQVFHRDYGNTNGSQQAPNIMEWANISIRKSVILGTQVNGATIAANTTNERNTYSGVFTNSIAPVFHRSAIGTLKLLDLAFESEYSVSRQATLVVAKYLMGHGVLRPESAVEIKTA